MDIATTVGPAIWAIGDAEGPYDVIVTDLRLSGQSGQELAHRLRRPWLICLSGDARAVAAASGFDLLLHKPVNAERLLQEIARGHRGQGP